MIERHENGPSRRIYWAGLKSLRSAADLIALVNAVLDYFGELFASEGVLDAANGVTDFAGSLVGLAFAFELGVASQLAGDLFDFSLSLLGRALDPILIHGLTPLIVDVAIEIDDTNKHSLH